MIRTANLETMECWNQVVLDVVPFIDQRNPRPAAVRVEMKFGR